MFDSNYSCYNKSSWSKTKKKTWKELEFYSKQIII